MPNLIYRCDVCESSFESGKAREQTICDPCIGVLRSYGLGPIQRKRPSDRTKRLQARALRHGANIIVNKIMAAHLQKPDKVMHTPESLETETTVLQNVQRLLASL